ncbi:MAG TPA: hypothetical protein VH436_27150 [Vicinamibacterales bacterium]|jgi:hypothetical protein
MRRDRFAEGLLSLVAPADHAASVVGDLMEEADARGSLWFWQCVVRLAFSLLARDLLAAPLTLAAASVLSWFVYMAVCLVLGFGAYVIVTLIWGAAYVLSHHTGVELLTDILRLRFDWPPVPASVTSAIQVIVFFAVAPFQIGRGSAPYWRRHELTVALVMLLIWSAMAVLVPFVGVGIAATPRMMPVVLTFVLIGLLSGRRRTATPAS